MSLSSPHFIAVKFESSDSNGTIGDAQPLCPYLQSNLWCVHLEAMPLGDYYSKQYSYLQNWKNSLFQHFNGLGLKGQKLENDCLALHNVENAVDKVYYAGNKSLGNLTNLIQPKEPAEGAVPDWFQQKLTYSAGGLHHECKLYLKVEICCVLWQRNVWTRRCFTRLFNFTWRTGHIIQGKHHTSPPAPTTFYRLCPQTTYFYSHAL
ncbi:hypothetical protein K438DRAFT_1765621 [Mycena galopus ATCC 62051]|nr:hypothetical protein K438DRAFT_1765621 [Mycena galopus ATCC 62051]